jgi:hypothetical protein
MSLSINEKISNGLKALERLKPALHLERGARPPSYPSHPGHTIAQADPAGGNGQRTRLNLDELLAQTGPFPPGTIILGACEDGLPFTLDLNNPAPGALLYSSNQAEENSAWLHAALLSAMRLNTSRNVHLWVVAARSEAYLDVIQYPHLRHLAASEDLVTSALIQEVVELVEQRRHGDPHGPACILAIDDLASLLHNLDEELYRSLNILLRHGPRSRVWPIVTLDASQANQVDERLLPAFRTRLIGRMPDYDIGAYLAQDDRLDASQIDEQGQFFAPFGDEWIRVWACQPATA